MFTAGNSVSITERDWQYGAPVWSAVTQWQRSHYFRRAAVARRARVVRPAHPGRKGMLKHRTAAMSGVKACVALRPVLFFLKSGLCHHS